MSAEQDKTDQIEVLKRNLDQVLRMLAISKQASEPMFPIAARHYDSDPHPMSVPRSVAEIVFSGYSRKYRNGLSLDTIAERGGFGPAEMSEFYPGWIEAASEITTLRSAITSARADLVERDQEIFVKDNQLRELSQQYDELAHAIGWSPERCTQAGDSPLDVARELVHDVVQQRAELIKLR
jgi:hypothetical protein